MTSFTDVIAAAQDTVDPDAYIERVKRAVTDEIRDLDPSAEIVDTHYFNHSAIPDLVVKWKRDRAERSVYLRDSYAAVAAANDIAVISDADPIVLSLDSHDSESTMDAAARVYDGDVARTYGQKLLTDVSAMESIGVEPSGAPSPMRSLVRANFIRGAKGLIDTQRAEDLSAVPSPADQTSSGTHSLAAMVGEYFNEAAASRITRTAQLIDLALGNASNVDDDNGAPAGTRMLAGRLSGAEIRHLLPWLLGTPSVRQDAEFWRTIGSMMTFADLEVIRDDIAGLNLDPIIKANSKTWQANRAYLGIAQRDEEYYSTGVANDSWGVIGKSIGINVAEQRLMISSTGYVLKGRSSSSSATWENLLGPIEAFKVANVQLKGITRSFAINAERSDDIRSDVERVTHSLDDTYFVSAVGVRFPAPGGAEGTVDVQLNLDTKLAVAPDGAALADLANASLRLLNPTDDVSEQEIESLTTLA